LYPAFVSGDTDGVIKHLCSITAADARAVIEKCTESSELFHVAVYHGFNDLISMYANLNANGVVKYLCCISASEARPLLEKVITTGEFLSVAVHHGFTDLYPYFLSSNADGVVEHLCSIDVNKALSMLEKWLHRHPQLIRVAAYHGFTDLVISYILREPASAVKHLGYDSAIKYMCRCDSSQTRPIVERHIADCRFIRVAVHHGFTDLVKIFITRDSDGSLTSPAWTPTSPHRLSQNDAENAWLWLMIGDGQLDDKVWEAVEAGGLVSDGSSAAILVDGVYKSGRKVTAGAVTFLLMKYPDALTGKFRCRRSYRKSRHEFAGL
jgi:hypothetical protein